jgi:hypothetical protein
MTTEAIILIMFGSVISMTTGLTFIEVRRLRKLRAGTPPPR